MEDGTGSAKFCGRNLLGVLLAIAERWWDYEGERVKDAAEAVTKSSAVPSGVLWGLPLFTSPPQDQR